MKPKPYKINGSWDVEKCVIKVNYGRAYIILKCKKQITTLQKLEKDIAAYFRGNEPNPGSLYYNLLLYCKRNPKNAFSVETIMESDSALDLLKTEQQALDQARYDKHCMNNNVEAYIPQYNEETGMYGWITRTEVMNFRNWMKNKRVRPKRKNQSA